LISYWACLICLVGGTFVAGYNLIFVTAPLHHCVGPTSSRRICDKQKADLSVLFIIWPSSVGASYFKLSSGRFSGSWHLPHRSFEPRLSGSSRSSNRFCWPWWSLGDLVLGGQSSLIHFDIWAWLGSVGVSPFFFFGLVARRSFTLHVALFLARAFRREIGGGAAALRYWASCFRDRFVSGFLLSPTYMQALDEWECWNAGFR